MSRALLLILVVALALSIGWFLWQALAPGDAPSAVGGGDPATPESAAPAAPAEPDPRPARAPEPPAPGETAKNASSSPSPAAAVGESETLPAHRRGPRLLVIDGRSGEPIPGALVGVVSRGEVPTPWRAFWSYGFLGFEEVVRRFGTRRRSAADGGIVLPPFINAVVVGCRHGSLWTREEISLERPPMDGVWRMVLYPERRLEVVVTDAIGRPQSGVGLSLEVENDDDRVTTDGRDLRVRSDIGGHAVFQLREALLVHARKGNRVHLRMEVPGVQSERREVELDPWPRGPVKFVLPPCGRVEVTVRGQDGPPRVPCRVRLSAQVGGACQALTRDGVAVFPHVGLGRSLRIRVYVPRRKDIPLGGDGPRQDGETVRFSTVVDDRENWITGSAVGAGGESGPSGMQVRLLWAVKPGGTTFRSFGALDAAGRFRMRRGPFVGRYPALKVRLQTLDWRGIREQSGWREVTPGASGDLDVGIFTLSPAPLWVSGRVEDETGAPMSWVEIRVSHGNMMRHPLLPSAFRVVRSENSSETRRYHTRTDVEGRFEVRGPLPPDGAFALEFSKRFAASNRRSYVEPGATGRVITLIRYGEIAGRVLAPPALDPADVLLRVVCRRDKLQTEIGLDAAGRFRSDSVRPGVHDIGVLVLGAVEPVLTIPDVEVAGGARTEDPRLEEIELRGRVALITLTLRGPGGEKPVGARILLRGRGESWREVKADANGQARVWTGPLGVEVEATAADFRRVRVQGVNADRTLTLARGIPIQLHYGGIEALPPRAVVLLRVSLDEEAEGHDTGARWPEPRARVAGHPADTIRTALALPGRYHVEVSLRDGRKGKTAAELAASTPHVIVTEAAIVVRDVEALQSFSVTVDRKSMLEAIAEFNQAIEDGAADR